MEWISSVIACLALVFSSIIALFANHRAKAANSIAEKALAQAQAANEFAENANKLSEEANTISEKALLHASEDSFVQWLPEWNAEENVLLLENRGRDIAFKPSIVVIGDEVHELGRGKDTKPGEKINIELKQVAEKRANIKDRIMFSGGGGHSFAVPGSLRITLNVDVLWKTENGFPQRQNIQYPIDESGGAKRGGRVW